MLNKILKTSVLGAVLSIAVATSASAFEVVATSTLKGPQGVLINTLLNLVKSQTLIFPLNRLAVVVSQLVTLNLLRIQ